MDDKYLIAKYWERSETALELTQERYGGYCRYISMQVLHDKSASKEICNDVLLKAWQTIPPQRPASLKSYLGMLTRQLSINRYKADTAGRRGGGEFAVCLDELAEAIPSGAEDMTAESIAIRDALNGFLKGLRRRDRRVFLQRYWYVCSTTEIAQEHGMTESGVRTLLTRLRKKLKEHLEKEDLHQ